MPVRAIRMYVAALLLKVSSHSTSASDAVPWMTRAAAARLGTRPSAAFLGLMAVFSGVAHAVRLCRADPMSATNFPPFFLRPAQKYR